MKVLYFHQHFSTPKGSTAIRSYAMAKALSKKGHEVVMVCGSYLGSHSGVCKEFVKGKRRDIVDGIDVIEFQLPYANTDNFLKRSLIFLKYVIGSLKLIFTEKYDLVFATTTPLTAGIPGVVAKWFRNKPFMFEVRDLWPELPKAMGVITNPLILNMLSILEWLIYHSAHHIIALSPGIAEGIEKRGISSNKITLIPNGCDLNIFNKNIKPWRPKEISKNDLLVLFAGTHGIANGLHSVLDAASELNFRGRKDIKFLFLGQGKLKQSLIDRAVNENLQNVIFSDPIDKRKLARLMSASDIGLQILANVPAFYFGTSPNKFFDYISAGVPVLNNYPGWLAELITKNHCGFVVPPDDPVIFANTLEKASQNRKDLKIKGLKAKALAESEFDRNYLASVWVDKIENVYRTQLKL